MSPTRELYTASSWRITTGRDPSVLSDGGAVMVSVAGIIRECRVSAGLSARQLSTLAGLSPSYIGKIEGGEIEPSLKAFAKIAKALRLSKQEISFCVEIAANDLTVTPPAYTDRTPVR